MSETTGPSMRDHHVAPHRLALGRLRPPVGDPGAADKRDGAVDDEQLAVGAVVEPREAVPRKPVIRLDAAAGLAQRPRRRVKRAKAADRVHHDRRAHAGPRALGKRVDELLTDLAFLEDVALEVDRFPCAANRLEHRRIEVIAVREDVDLVVVFERRVARRLEHVDEVIARAVDLRLDVIRDVRCEEHDENEPRDERAADNREIEHQRAGATSSATGKRSNTVAAASVGAPRSRLGRHRRTGERVDVARIPSRGEECAYRPTRVPSGGADASGVSVAISRGTQVMAIRSPSRLANANRQSRRAPAVSSATYSPCSYTLAFAARDRERARDRELLDASVGARREQFVDVGACRQSPSRLLCALAVVDRAPVVGIDQRQIPQLGALIKIRHARRGDLDEQLREAVVDAELGDALLKWQEGLEERIRPLPIENRIDESRDGLFVRLVRVSPSSCGPSPRAAPSSCTRQGDLARPRGRRRALRTATRRRASGRADILRSRPARGGRRRRSCSAGSASATASPPPSTRRESPRAR